MPDDTNVYCRDASLAAGEPLAGSAAAKTSSWLVLETREPWGPRGIDDSGLPGSVQERLNELSDAHRTLRIQLIRKPGREASKSGFCLYLAHSERAARSLTLVSLASLEQLCTLDLDAWALGASLGTPIKEPLYLICVHGRRDRCCAQRGMPLYSEFAAIAAEQTWQTTHLGGHRFAATMLVLPEGICYGRVEASEARAIASAHERGELHDLARLRGRCSLRSAEQAAEVMLREALAERGLDTFELLDSEKVSGVHRVRFRDLRTAREHVVEVRQEALPALVASCGAKPKTADCYVSLRVPTASSAKAQPENG
jgi:hypothetical protein